MSNLLLDSYPLVIIPELACVIGLNEAIVLQQVHYWVNHNKERKQNFRDGRYWVYNSYRKWQEFFPFWCERTVKTIFSRLEKDGLLISGNYNKSKLDKTKWYSIDYDALKKLISDIPLGKNCTMDNADCNQAIPETSKETNKKVTKGHSEGAPRDNVFDVVTKKYGYERAKYMLSLVDWYIDKGYPAYTKQKHPSESKAKRMTFADKLLEFSTEVLDGDDNLVAKMLQRALQNYTNCDPTIYYVTTDRVMGYWIIQDEDVGYESVNFTKYAPVESIY